MVLLMLLRIDTILYLSKKSIVYYLLDHNLVGLHFLGSKVHVMISNNAELQGSKSGSLWQINYDTEVILWTRNGTLGRELVMIVCTIKALFTIYNTCITFDIGFKAQGFER